MHFCQQANKRCGCLRQFALLQRACSAIAEVCAAYDRTHRKRQDFLLKKSTVRIS